MDRQETCAYLTAHGIEYEITEHPAVYNMAEAALLELPYPEGDAKSLFVRDAKKRRYFLICVQGDRRVDLKAFRRQNGLPGLSFASEEELREILGLFPGAVTPLGLLQDAERKTELYLDAGFRGKIGVHPNDNTATVWMDVQDLIRLIEEHGNRVHVVDL